MNYSTRVALGVKDCYLELDEKHFAEPMKIRAIESLFASFNLIHCTAHA